MISKVFVCRFVYLSKSLNKKIFLNIAISIFIINIKNNNNLKLFIININIETK